MPYYQRKKYIFLCQSQEKKNLHFKYAPVIFENILEIDYVVSFSDFTQAVVDNHASNRRNRHPKVLSSSKILLDNNEYDQWTPSTNKSSNSAMRILQPDPKMSIFILRIEFILMNRPKYTRNKIE